MDLNQFEQMDDLTTLHSLKEKLKDEIIDNNITWQYRIQLYTQIKTINERILHLKNLHKTTT